MYFGDTPDEIENKRKRLLILFFSGLGSVFLFVFGSISFINERWLLGTALFSFLLLVALISYFALKITRVHELSMVLAAALLLLAAYLLLGGGAEGTGVFWSYSISMLMVLLVGPKTGAVYMGVYLLLVGIGLYGDFSATYDYSDVQASRILVTSVALYVLILSSEWIRFKSYGAIADTYESNRQLANTDPLTKALNRAGLENAVRAVSDKTGGALVLLDIDDFKLINDTHGHDAGDHILVQLVELLKKHTKGRDLVVRFGGEEFLLVLFETTPDAAYNLVDRIRKEFSKVPFQFGEKNVFCTFSAGVSCMNDRDGMDSGIKQADEKLYAAKRAGRDRVIV